ncbi:unnamed protein product, partial [Citrullus colocynthis]
INLCPVVAPNVRGICSSPFRITLDTLHQISSLHYTLSLKLLLEQLPSKFEYGVQWLSQTSRSVRASRAGGQQGVRAWLLCAYGSTGNHIG